MKILNSGEPVFVHCREGKDRTGVVIACYRIAHDGWQNSSALREAKSFGLHWVQLGIKSYISSYRGHPGAPVPVAALVPSGR